METKYDLYLTDLIHRDTLQKMQDAFARLTGMSVIITDTNGVAVTNGSNFSDFCRNYMRKSPVGCMLCAQSNKAGTELALKNGKSTVYPCYSGLMNFASPIMVEGRLVGCVIGGQVLTEMPDPVKIKIIAAEIGAEPEAFVGGTERTRAMDGLAVGQPGTEGLAVGDLETQELDIGDWETERLDLEEPETRNLYIEKSDIGEPGVENLYKEEPDQGGMETQALHKEDTGTERLVIEGLRTKKQTGEQCTFEWVTEKLSAFGSGEPDRENALPDRAKDHAQEGAQTANFEVIQDIVYVQETAPAI